MSRQQVQQPVTLPPPGDPKTNVLLGKLNEDDYAAVMAKAQVIEMKFRKTVFRQDQPIEAIFFPLNCMISLLVTSESKIELAAVGKEGVIGAAELLSQKGAIGLNLVQIAGIAVRVPAKTFLTEMRNRPGLQGLVHSHMYALTRQILYSAGCSKLHGMDERCARWLLMTSDLAGQNTFQLTQEFVSHMLGVRRATVNVAIGMLKRAGFIHFVRGKLSILDRPGLESAACSCYQDIKKTYSNALNNNKT